LSYARPYRPQGKGKIERFFRTVRTQLLPELPEQLSLEQLNSRFDSYIEHIYHQRVHGGTGQTPLDRYLQDAKALRRAPQNLPEYFRKQARRKVNLDRTVKLDGRLYEAPAGLISRQVTLRYENYDRVEVFLDEKPMGFLTELDRNINSRVGRAGENPRLQIGREGGKLFEQLSRQDGA